MTKWLCASLLGALLLVPASAPAASWQPEGVITQPGSGQLFGSADPDTGEALFAWQAPGGATLDYRTRPRSAPPGPVASVPYGTRNIPEFASASNNRAVLAWSDPDPTPGVFNYRYLRGTIRDPGGGFSEPATLHDTGTASSLCRVRPVVTEPGDVVIIFGVRPATTPSSGNDCRYFMKVRPAGAPAFGEPVPISDEFIDVPAVAFDDDGNGILAWRGPATTDVRVRRYARGGTLLAEERVAVEGEAVPRLDGRLVLEVSGASGRAILGFPSAPPGRDEVHVAAAIGTTTSSFGEANILSGPASLTSGQLGPFFDGDAGDDGSLGLTWRSGTRGSRVRIQAVVAGPRDREVTDDDTQRLSGYGVQTPRMAVADNGRATVIWLTRTTNGRALDARVGDARAFDARQRLTTGPVDPRPQPVVELNERGDAFAVWAEGTVNRPDVRAAKGSRSTGRFSRALDVVRPSTNGPVAFIVLPGSGVSMYVAALGVFDTGTAGWDLRSYAEG